MPEYSITHDAMSNIAHHLAQESKYFEQEGETAKQQEFEELTDVFSDAASSGVRDITLRIVG
ncbi:MAG: hypothetical protein OXM01_07345 [Gemmatimonadota bacterium]|nr:hypothetical protein [Gemmatimonadota bacterium]